MLSLFLAKRFFKNSDKILEGAQGIASGFAHCYCWHSSGVGGDGCVDLFR